MNNEANSAMALRYSYAIPQLPPGHHHPHSDQRLRERDLASDAPSTRSSPNPFLHGTGEFFSACSRPVGLHPAGTRDCLC